MFGRRLLSVSVFFFLAFIATSCTNQNASTEKRLFGKLTTGEDVYMFTIKNKNGMSAEIINFGATVVSLKTPDRTGKLADVVLGYDNPAHYETDKAYFGTIVGRYGNRIGKGKFTLDGKEYQLTINDGENHLHGGLQGFDKKVWSAEQLGDNAVRFEYDSPDGEQGYPGNVKLAVTYTLTDDNGLRIDFSGSTDAPTILNPTNHCYFNLTGSPENTILAHELFIDADKLTPVDQGLIPTGELVDVANTPLDFRTPTPVGARIAEPYPQLQYGHGYDHNFVLSHYDGTVRPVATVHDPQSGRFLEVLTDQPGLQFYSGNFLDGTIAGKNNIVYKQRTGLCLEAQCFPDSPNKPHFPSVVLRPGQTYQQTTIYRFSSK